MGNVSQRYVVEKVSGMKLNCRLYNILTNLKWLQLHTTLCPTVEPNIKKIKLQNFSYQKNLYPFNILFSSLDIDNRNFLVALHKKIGQTQVCASVKEY